MLYSAKRLACALLAVAVALASVGCGGNSDSPDIAPHLVPAQSEHVPAIDGYEEIELPDVAAVDHRTRVDALYTAVVYDRKKPVFEKDDPLEPIYSAARGMLLRYVSGEWSGKEREINTVHTVHDWLIAEIEYDFELYRLYQTGNTELSSDPAFYIDGVFGGGKAVCDGLARAFNFLCAMEDIESVRVTGTFASAPHAWNKVKISGEWYNVDVTADAVHYSVDDKQYKQLAHGFMLLGDDTLGSFAPGGHVLPASELTAARDYDYYANETVEIVGARYPRTVHTQAELNEIFAAVDRSGGSVGKLELKLDFAGKTQVNGADMYFAEICEAYSEIDDPYFDIYAVEKPYFRYPNGVYLFLIYK